MKRILTFLLLIALSFSINAQVQTKSYYRKNETIQNQPTLYIDWKLTNQGCWGCASFYWSVNRQYIPSMGQYKFDIWFYSNSFYANGQWASTYVQGLYFFVDGYNLYKDPAWLLFKDKYTTTFTSFYTSNPTPVVKITWSSMSIY